jgi:rod shape-determining protein MreC
VNGLPRRATYKKAFYLAVLVLSVLALVKYTAFGMLSVSPVEAALRDVLSPVQGLVTQMGHRIKGLVSFPFDVVGMTGRNRELSTRLKEVEGQLRQMEEYRKENERLKILLGFNSSTARAMGLELKTAAVIGRDPGNWFGMIRINKGSIDGIGRNMTVMTPAGLVGRVTSVSSDTAEVLLITDPRSGVGALIQENRAPGLVEGIVTASGQVRMVHIPTGSEIEKGQTVVTSGLGSLYHKGIPIGTVSSLGRESSGLFISAAVKPFVDFDRLEEVMVITAVKAPDTKVSLSDIPPPWGSAGVQGSSAGNIRDGG